jgi:hypothetical protein
MDSNVKAFHHVQAVSNIAHQRERAPNTPMNHVKSTSRAPLNAFC